MTTTATIRSSAIAVVCECGGESEKGAVTDGRTDDEVRTNHQFGEESVARTAGASRTGERRPQKKTVFLRTRLLLLAGAKKRTQSALLWSFIKYDVEIVQK